MRILGIDPGFGRVGWGVIDVEKGKLTPVACGCIETEKNTPLSPRLLQISKELKRIIATYKPEAAGVETLYFGKNVTTGIDVGHARGVILLVLAEAGLLIAESTPVEVKMAVTGYGQADKVQVQTVVAMHLGLKEKRLQDDAADGLAIAIATIQKVQNKAM
jgi:crossover junction endodeoxyribonuclease RuvC